MLELWFETRRFGFRAPCSSREHNSSPCGAGWWGLHSLRHRKGALTYMCVLFSAWLGHPLFFLTLYKHTGFNDVISFNQLNVFKHPLILFWHLYFSIYRYFIWCYDSLTQDYYAVPSDKFCEGFSAVNFKDLDTHWHHLPKRILGGTHFPATVIEV